MVQPSGAGVVHRRGREVDRVRRPAVERLAQHGQAVRRVDRLGARLDGDALDALGLAGGARRIEHDRAGGLALDRGLGLSVAGGFEPLPARFSPAGHVELHVRDQRGELAGDIRQRLGRDQHLGFAVLDDVLDLARRQLGRDGGEWKRRPERWAAQSSSW